MILLYIAYCNGRALVIGYMVMISTTDEHDKAL